MVAAHGSQIELSNTIRESVPYRWGLHNCSLNLSSGHLEIAFIGGSARFCFVFVIDEGCKITWFEWFTNFEGQHRHCEFDTVYVTGSQCSSDKTGWICSYRFVLVMMRETLFCASCSMWRFAFDVPTRFELQYSSLETTTCDSFCKTAGYDAVIKDGSGWPYRWSLPVCRKIDASWALF